MQQLYERLEQAKQLETLVKAKPQLQTSESGRIFSRPGSAKSWVPNHKFKEEEW